MARTRAHLFGVALVAVGCSPSGGGQTEAQALAALLDSLRTEGVDLRPAENTSNVIDYMFSVGPDHDRGHLVGLNYWPGPHGGDELIRMYPIALPNEVHGPWVLWSVGDPGGNASESYRRSWDRVSGAVEACSVSNGPGG